MLPVAILAGGLATRLRSIAPSLPKSLVPVNGTPFLAHQLLLLREYGIERVVLCVGHLGEKVQEAIQDGSAYGIQVEYSFDGPALLGTAGALKRALPKLGDAFFVLYGDSYLVCDYPAIARVFTASGKLALMTVLRNEGQWDTSNVEFLAGNIVAYSKIDRNSRMQHIDYGLGVFSARAFDRLSPGQSGDLADVYADLLKHGELAGHEVFHRFYEIGSPSGLQEAARFLAERERAAETASRGMKPARPS